MTRNEQTVVLRIVAIVLAVIVLLMWFTRSAHADTGFLVDQYTRGGMRYCIYDVAGDTVIITVDYQDLCPMTIDI